MGRDADHVYETPVGDVDDLRQRLIDACCTALWTVLLMNGVRDFRHVCTKKETS